MRCCLDISNFLEERSLVFPVPSLSSLSLHCSLKGLSYLSLLFSRTLHSDGYIFPFLLCLSLLFFSQLFVRPPQTTILPFFFLGIVSCVESVYWSCFCIHPASLCLLVGTFNPFTFEVITGMYDPITILFIVLGLFFIDLYLLLCFLSREVPLPFLQNWFSGAEFS